MTRKEAIEFIIRRDITALTRNERESLLMDWWSIDSEDVEYANLPELLKLEMAKSTAPANLDSSFYDPLLYVALRDMFRGVINSYLERRLASLGCNSVVEGDVESLTECPCCRYRSIQTRGDYEICRVCFWEDDGTNDCDRVSEPNHMTLRTARENFKKFGAVTRDTKKYVLPDGNQRYAQVG